MSRLLLKQVEVTNLSQARCKIEVSIALKEETYKGELISKNREEDKLRGVAEATILAINKLLPQIKEMELVQSGQIALTKLSNEMYYVVVKAKSETDPQFLSGGCLFTTVNMEAPAKAVLDAINRKIEKYLSMEEI